MSRRRIFIEEIDGTNAIRIVFPYNKQLVQYTKKLRTIGVSRRYRKTPYKHWWVPATQWNAERILAHFDKWGFEISQEVKDLAEKDSIDVGPTRHPRDSELLRDYQVEAVNFIDATGGRCIIGDQMGLGKTVQALAWVNRHEDELERVAVICPASVAYKWQDECVRWLDLPESAVGVLSGFTSDWPDGAPIVISSYTTMAERYSEFVRWQPDLIIADEAHYLKNHKAQRTRAMKHLNSVATYFIAMSGTPFLNRPMEMFNVLNMIDGYEWGNAWEFGHRYAGGEIGKVEGGGVKGRTFAGRTNIAELRDRLQNYMIRRLKRDVRDELPEKTRTFIPLDIPNRSEYNKLWRRRYTNPLIMIGELWRAVGRGKAQAATSWVRDFFKSSDDNTKLVIKCHHVDNVIYLKEALDEYGVTTITGDVKGEERSTRIDKYQTPGGPRVIILTDAGSEGIDLFGLEGVDSSNILFVERSWSPAREEQAEGRLDRMGQTNAVEAHYLVARGTIDEYMAQVIEDKRAGIRDIVDLQEIETTVKEALTKEVLGG